MPPAALVAQARQPALAGRPNGVKWQKLIKMNEDGKTKNGRPPAGNQEIHQIPIGDQK